MYCIYFRALLIKWSTVKRAFQCPLYFRALFIKWSIVKGAFALCITQFVHTAREELNICHGKIICNSNIITNHPIDAAYFKTLWLAKCWKKQCAHIFISFLFFLFDFLLFKMIVQVQASSPPTSP